MSRITENNLKQNVIPAKRSASGNPEEYKALNTAGCPIRSGMTGSSEHGRSMVEMLGVLAVIGVLSVAGIAGYTTAMRSYRTNEILNEASKLYILAMAQSAGNGPTGTNPVGYSSVGGTNPSGVDSLNYDPTSKQITIAFKDPNDCTMALNKLGDKASANTCSEATATITVNFGEAVVDEPAVEGGDCISGFACSNSSFRVMACVNNKWNETHLDYSQYDCTSGCIDEKAHPTMAETCSGPVVFH